MAYSLVTQDNVTPQGKKIKWWALLLADPGKARGCSTNTCVTHWFTDSFIHSFTDPLVRMSLWRRHSQTVIKGSIQSYWQFFRDSKYWRASKSLYWFKSYSDFAERVFFAYWWSFIGKGLRLQSAQQAIFIITGWKKCNYYQWIYDFSSILALPWEKVVIISTHV